MSINISPLVRKNAKKTAEKRCPGAILCPARHFTA